MGLELERAYFRLICLGRKGKRVLGTPFHGFEHLHILQLYPSAAPGGKGEDTEPEELVADSLDKGRVDAAADNLVVRLPGGDRFHDLTLNAAISDPEDQIGDDGALGQLKGVGTLDFHVRRIGEHLIDAGDCEAVVNSGLHVHGGQFHGTKGPPPDGTVHGADCRNSFGGAEDQCKKEKVAGSHRAAPIFTRPGGTCRRWQGWRPYVET